MGRLTAIAVLAMISVALAARNDEVAALKNVTSVPAAGDAVGSARAYVLKEAIAKPETPEFEALVAWLGGALLPDGAGNFQVNAGLLTRAVARAKTCGSALDSLRQANPPPAWLSPATTALAMSIIRDGVEDDRDLGQRLGTALAAGAPVVIPAEDGAIQQGLKTAWPGYADAAPQAKKAIMDEVDALNPGLVAHGWQRVPAGGGAEAWPHLDISVGGATLRYRWEPIGGPVLIPARAHLQKVAASAKSLAPEYFVHTPKRWCYVLNLGTEMRLYVAGEEATVVSATVVIPSAAEQIILANIVDDANADAKSLPRLGQYYDQPDWPKTLKREGDRLTGTLAYTTARKGNAVEATISLDVTLSEAGATGTFKTGASNGAVTGRPQVPADALAAGAGWMTFRGNNGSSSAGDTAPAMVADPKKWKLAWVSHDLLPHGEGSDMRTPRHAGESMMGGFATPAAAGNRVFISYWRPSGTALVKSLASRDKTGREAIYALLIRADDVTVGFDAQTGATAWKTIFPLKGANRGTMHKSGFQGSACAFGDAVYVMGSQLKMYCLDAATGQPRWESDTGPGHRRIEQELAASMKAGGPIGSSGRSAGPEWMNRGLQSMPRIIDGVLVVHDGQRFNAGLVGIDPATGKRLWHTAMVSDWVPLVWRHDGREYVIGLGAGAACAVDPRSGKVLWRLANVNGGYIGSNAVCRDILTAHAAGGLRAGYRMTLTGCAKVWDMPSELSHSGTPATAHRGRFYFFSKDTAAMVVVDPPTGKVIAKVPHPPGAIIEHGTQLVAAGDRMWSDTGREMQGYHYWDVSADEPKCLGALSAPRTAGYAIAVEPALVDGRMLIRLHDRLACYDLRGN